MDNDELIDRWMEACHVADLGLDPEKERELRRWMIDQVHADGE